MLAGRFAAGTYAASWRPCGSALTELSVHTDGAEPDLDGSRERVADRGAAEAVEEVDLVDRLGDEPVVGRRRRRHLRLACEEDEADLEPRRHLVEERVQRALRRDRAASASRRSPASSRRRRARARPSRCRSRRGDARADGTRRRRASRVRAGRRRRRSSAATACPRRRPPRARRRSCTAPRTASAAA